MLPQFGASKLSTDCDNSQRFNSYLRAHHVHCKRTCPFAPPSHASLSHTRPLKMTCLMDTQLLSQNRSSAIAAHTDDFIHTARHCPDRTDKACTKPRKPPLQPWPPLPPKPQRVQNNRRPTLIRIVSVPTSRFELSGNKSRISEWAYKLSTGTVAEDLRRLVADFSNAPRGVCQRAPSTSTCRNQVCKSPQLTYLQMSPCQNWYHGRNFPPS